MIETKLMHGDCLELMRDTPSNSVDLILTDPPYFKVKNEQWDNQWSKPDTFLAWLDSVLAEFQRILKPNGSLYMFASPQMAARVEVLIGERFNVLNSIRWEKKAGWHKKTRKEALRRYLTPWEAIIFAEQTGNLGLAGEVARMRIAAGLSRSDVANAIGCDSRLVQKWEETDQFGQRSTITFSQWISLHSICSGGDATTINQDVAAVAAERYEQFVMPFYVTDDVPYTDTWHFDTVKHYPGKHPCEKPAAMLEHIIKASSRPGAVVFDAFMGTGSAGVACVNTGRQFIGIERDEKYFAIAKERLEAMK